MPHHTDSDSQFGELYSHKPHGHHMDGHYMLSNVSYHAKAPLSVKPHEIHLALRPNAKNPPKEQKEKTIPNEKSLGGLKSTYKFGNKFDMQRDAKNLMKDAPPERDLLKGVGMSS